MITHEKALEWQELFDLMVLNEMDKEDIVVMGYRVTGKCICYFFWSIELIMIHVEDLLSKNDMFQS